MYAWPTHMELPNTHAHTHRETHTHSHRKKNQTKERNKKTSVCTGQFTGCGALPYNRSGVLPPSRPVVTSVRYMSPGGHDISPQAFRQGHPATMQTVSGSVISVPIPPTQFPLVSGVPKRARSPALPRDSNDESHAFKSGVNGINYFCPDRN